MALSAADVRQYVVSQIRPFNKDILEGTPPAELQGLEALNAITAVERTTGGGAVGSSLTPAGRGSKWANGEARSITKVSLSTTRIPIERHQDAKSVSLVDIADLAQLGLSAATVMDQLKRSAHNNKILGRVDVLLKNELNYFTDAPMFHGEHRILIPHGATQPQYITVDNDIVGDDTDRPGWILAGEGALLRVEQEDYQLQSVGDNSYHQFMYDELTLGWRARHTDTAGNPLSAIRSNKPLTADSLQEVLTRVASNRDAHGMRLSPLMSTLIIREDSPDAAAAVKLLGQTTLPGGESNIFYNRFKLVLI